jgi:CysZ protein
VIGELVGGIHDGLRGAAYLARHPRLWLWVLAPAIVAAVVLILAIGWITAVVSPWLAGVAAFMPGHWAENVLGLLLKIILLFLSFTIFLSFAALIAAPFNEMLSESIEEHETGVPGPKFSIVRFLVDLAIGIAHGARRVTVYLLIMAGLFILGIAVPAFGTAAAAVLGAIATARFASYDAYDAIWARRRLKYRAKIEYLRANRFRTLGLGALVGLLLVVPGLNVVGLSIGATAATLRVIACERA